MRFFHTILLKVGLLNTKLLLLSDDMIKIMSERIGRHCEQKSCGVTAPLVSHLRVFEFAVHQVHFTVHGPDTGVGVILSIFTDTVRETVL